MTNTQLIKLSGEVSVIAFFLSVHNTKSSPSSWKLIILHITSDWVRESHASTYFIVLTFDYLDIFMGEHSNSLVQRDSINGLLLSLWHFLPTYTQALQRASSWVILFLYPLGFFCYLDPSLNDQYAHLWSLCFLLVSLNKTWNSLSEQIAVPSNMWGSASLMICSSALTHKFWCLAWG